MNLMYVIAKDVLVGIIFSSGHGVKDFVELDYPCTPSRTKFTNGFVFSFLLWKFHLGNDATLAKEGLFFCRQKFSLQILLWPYVWNDLRAQPILCLFVARWLQGGWAGRPFVLPCVKISFRRRLCFLPTPSSCNRSLTLSRLMSRLSDRIRPLHEGNKKIQT